MTVLPGPHPDWTAPRPGHGRLLICCLWVRSPFRAISCAGAEGCRAPPRQHPCTKPQAGPLLWGDYGHGCSLQSKKPHFFNLCSQQFLLMSVPPRGRVPASPTNTSHGAFASPFTPSESGLRCSAFK